jgi:Mg2+-importing ATPase
MFFIFNSWRDPATFQTGWLVGSLLSQTLIIHVIQTARGPFVESCARIALIATSVVIGAVGVVLTFTGIGTALGFTPLPGVYCVVLSGILSGCL